MKRAFTIVELVIYMGLVISLFVVLGTLFADTLHLQLESQSTSQVESDGRYLIARLAYDIHRASSLTTPAAPGQSGSSLTLVVAGQTYTYALTGSQLLLTTPTGTFNLTDPNTVASNYTVTRLANSPGIPTTRITFNLTSGSESRSYTTTVGLR